MPSHERWFRLLGSAALATAATTAAGMLLSAVQTRRPAAALNATSHILWGDKAARANDFDVKHTLAGGALNAGAMVSWAAVSALMPRAHTVSGAVAKGALVSALAYVVDYYVVPKRLTPGFELRLSPTGLFAMYVTLAAAFAAGERIEARA